MGFSRKPRFTMSDKNIDLTKRIISGQLTKEEQERFDKELDEMDRESEMDTRSEEDRVREIIACKGSMDYPQYFDGKYKKY